MDPIEMANIPIFHILCPGFLTYVIPDFPSYSSKSIEAKLTLDQCRLTGAVWLCVSHWLFRICFHICKMGKK